MKTLNVKTMAYIAIVVGCGWTAWSNEAEAACLSRPAPIVAGHAPGSERVIAPRSQVAHYESLGFSVETCTLSPEEMKQVIERLCTVAANLPRDADTRMASNRGYTIKEACDSGRAAIMELTATQ